MIWGLILDQCDDLATSFVGVGVGFSNLVVKSLNYWDYLVMIQGCLGCLAFFFRVLSNLRFGGVWGVFKWFGYDGGLILEAVYYFGCRW